MRVGQTESSVQPEEPQTDPHQLLINFSRNPTMKLVSVLFLLLAPLLTSCSQGVVRPMDCSDIQHQGKNHQSGVYTIYPLGEKSDAQVCCDMDSNGGGWTVFQKRMDGTVNFYRNWDQYKMGFGNADGEYWLGLDNIHYLTTKQKYELMVYMEDFDGNNVSAHYSSFSVAAECEGYKLTVSGFTDGGAEDAMAYHNGMKFTTFDKDQDAWPKNCAKSFLGAFWYKDCHRANPNGVYRWGLDDSLFAVGACWFQYKGHNYSMKTYTMMIRPVQ